LSDDSIREYLNKEEIKSIFSYDRYLKNVDYIYKRVFYD